MQKQKFDEIISYVNKKVSEMEIETKYKMELLGMVTALGYAHEKETHDKCTETHACDLIDRQEAIKVATRFRVASGGEIFEAIRMAVKTELEQLPSAQPDQRWIPCSEKLPERGKDVLVTRHYLGEEDNNKSCYYTEVAARYGDDDNPDWISYSDEYKIHPKNHIVIAWQYLPEAYRGKQNEH